MPSEIAASPKPSRISLSVMHDFKASHSLEGFEQPHFHLWKVSAEFAATFPLQNDKLIDLVFLQNTLHEIIAPIQNRYLNDCLPAAPTTENLCEWFWQAIQGRLPEAPLSAVAITICNLEGEATGAARLAL
jgi:6-pyruvoyl-tetrahydropterin synthase